MQPQAAQFVLYAITGVASIAWLAGALFVWRTARAVSADETATPTDDWSEPPAPDERRHTGTVEVSGQPADLSRKAAGFVAQGKLGVPVKIISQSDEELSFEPLPAAGRWTLFRRATLQFVPFGEERTEIHYEVVSDRNRGRWHLSAARVCVTLGLLSIGVGFWLADTYLVNAPNPAARAQVWQMVQVIHFLWPPFLFAGLYRLRNRITRHWSEHLLDGLVHNLPYLE
jgi:hypothetical protein